jgi:poly-gamma-glutamate synthesis protein (capsule biosynthesis protein)
MRFLPAREELHVSDTAPAASLLAVGDLCLWGAVERAFCRRGASGLLGGFAEILQSCDLRIANLECVLTSVERPDGVLGWAYLKASPAAVRVLTDYRFDAVTVANNHSLDYGSAALLESLDLLDQHGVRHCGGGENLAAARTPVLLEANGLRVGMLGYCDEYRTPTGAAVGPAREDLVLEDIRLLRPLVDLLVLQLHWGYEFSLYPLLMHRERSRRFAAAGADLVLCHHAHVPMGLEVFGRSLIAHGLGNFLFTQRDPLQREHPWTDRAFALAVRFGKHGISTARLLPCGIGPDCSVHPLRGAARAELLGAVKLLSRRVLNTNWLARIERDRMLLEGFALVKAFARSRPSPERVRELATRLQSLHWQELIRWLLDNHPGRVVGEFLARVAQCPNNAPEMAAEIDREPLAGSLRQAARLARLRTDLPGRIP